MNRRRFFAAVVGGSVAPKVGTLGRLTQPERIAALAGMIRHETDDHAQQSMDHPTERSREHGSLTMGAEAVKPRIYRVRRGVWALQITCPDPGVLLLREFRSSWADCVAMLPRYLKIRKPVKPVALPAYLRWED